MNFSHHMHLSSKDRMSEEVTMHDLSHKLSDVPSAINLKQRSISDARGHPSGCGPSPQQQDVTVTHSALNKELVGDDINPGEFPHDEEQNISSHKAGASTEEGHAGNFLVTKGQNGTSLFRMKRQKLEEEKKTKSLPKNAESSLNRASSPQTDTDASSKSFKDNDKDKEMDEKTKEKSNLQVAGASGEITAGYFLKKTLKTSGWSRRWFVVNEKHGKLGYTKSMEETHFRAVIKLEDCIIEDVDEDEAPMMDSKKDKSNGPNANSLAFKLTNRVAYKAVLKAHSSIVIKAESMADKIEITNKIRNIIESRGGGYSNGPDGSLDKHNLSDCSLDTMPRRPADPEEELRWMSQEVRGYVDDVLNSLTANAPKAVMLCQVEKAKEDMLNLYSSVRMRSKNSEIAPGDMPADKEQNSDSSHKEGASIEEVNAGHSVVTEGQNDKSRTENDGASGQWWMRSKVYPPPKRRLVSAIRRYPQGCGRNLGLTVAGFNTKRVQHQNIGMNEAVLGKNTEKISDGAGGLNGNNKKVDEDLKGGDVNLSVIVKGVERAALEEKVDEKVSSCAERDTFKGKSASVDNNSTSVQSKVAKPIKIKIRFKEKKEEASEGIDPINDRSNERVKERTGSSNPLAIRKSPLKVIAKKKVGIKCPVSNYNPKFPRIDRRASEDVDLEEYASRAILQSRKRSSTLMSKISGSAALLCPNLSNIKDGQRVAKKSIPQLQASSSGLNGYQGNTSYFGPKKDKLTDSRAKVKRCLRLFQIIFQKLLHESESGKRPTDMGVNRIDLKTSHILGNLNETLNRDKQIIGSVPGVEVGDEYRYRAELHVLGLHGPLQGGIGSAKWKGIRVATSVVASGGYSDDMEGENVLIYTGAGGQPTGKPGHTEPSDQKLVRGNLALKNSMDMKTPVRVIHGQNTSDSSKVTMTFTYDGLYEVEEHWRDSEIYTVKGRPMEAVVFRFRLKRLEGQPELNWSKLEKVQRSAREGLCFKDMSLGQEKLPICVINTIDNEKPGRFRYITKTLYPSWYQKSQPKGCKCNGRCADAMDCSCAAKNGGQIPFNFNGAIIQTKALMYECGPMCGCPPSCYNRVSQHGTKFPLEVFKTKRRGWGVRSLCSIPSGKFVCEYIGELLQDQEAERRKNDEYLFDIGRNFNDTALLEGLPSDVPGLDISLLPNTDERADLSDGDEQEGFTIDAREMGNVGRFINHSCSPNLYAQNVLFDHDDKKMPHIMFFAAENIPPLKELTYHYNYTIGSVCDSDGNVKVKECYCGSSECRGRLY